MKYRSRVIVASALALAFVLQAQPSTGIAAPLPAAEPTLHFAARETPARPVTITGSQTGTVTLTVFKVPPTPTPLRTDLQNVPEHFDVPVPAGKFVPNATRNAPMSLSAALRTESVIRSSVVLPSGARPDPQVDEPTVAVKGRLVLFTANHYAASSTDGGTTFGYLSPKQAFKDTGFEFCCDQVAIYIPQIDTFVWSLQALDPGTQLLLYANSTEFAAHSFHKLLLTPSSLNVSGSLDYPDMAVGANMLYFSTNVFYNDGSASSVVVRIPLDGLKNHAPAPVATERRFGVRLVQNTGTTGYFAAHVDTSTLRVYSWDESAGDPTLRDVVVPTWNRTTLWGPVGSRVLGAARSGDNLWFAWNAGPADNRPFRYAAVVHLNAQTFALVESPDLYNNDFRIGLPSLGSNSVTGDIGIAYAFGDTMAEAVGLLTNTPVFFPVVNGGITLSALRWGDYLSVRQHYDDNGAPTDAFDATGYTYNATGGPEPRWIIFSRAGGANNQPR